MKHLIRVLAALMSFALVSAMFSMVAFANDAIASDDAVVVDKADFYTECEDDSAASIATFSSRGSSIEPITLSEDMKYFAKYESSQNYARTLSSGDGYNAMGYYQFDRRYDLQDFIIACYSYDSVAYAAFEPFTDEEIVDLSTVAIRVKNEETGKNEFTEIAKALNAAWKSAYESNPVEFAGLQDAWAYKKYYLPAENYLASRGIDISDRADCVKGLCWGLNNLFGSSGWRKFVGGVSDGYDWDGVYHYLSEGYKWPGCGLEDSMTDVEFVTVLCNYVVNNVSVFYKGQPQYHEGWENRYKNELSDCLSMLDSAEGLVKDEIGVRYRNSNGSYLAEEWLEIEGKTYYFAEDGYAVSGLQMLGGKAYYFDSSCAMLTGWKAWEDGSRTYFSKSGAAAKGWWTLSGIKYYFAPIDGLYRTVSGLMEIEGEFFLFNEDGSAYSGWKAWEDGSRTYFQKSGAAASGLVEVEGLTYYFTPIDGLYRTVSGLTEVSGKFYYFNEDGSAYSGWKTWEDGSRTYFSKSGAAAKGWWTLSGIKYYFAPIDGLYRTVSGLMEIEGEFFLFNEDGSAYSGWKAWEDGSRTYFQKSGAAASGLTKIDGKYYYFTLDDECPKMLALKGLQEIDDSYIYFNNDSSVHTGWLSWKDGGKSYFSTTSGKAASGWWSLSGGKYYFEFEGNCYKAVTGYQEIEGDTYYFGTDGVMRTSWVEWSDGTCSYFGPDGVMRFGTQEVNGTTYNFGSSGKTKVSNVVKLRIIDKGVNAPSDTAYCAVVDRTNNYVGLFIGEQGSRELVKYVRCSTGAYGDTRTPAGNFSVGYRGLNFGEAKGYTCWYYVQIHNYVLFHSVLYNPYSMTSIQDGRLGQNVSHGCVRLALENAKYIYDNVPRGSRVVVF